MGSIIMLMRNFQSCLSAKHGLILMWELRLKINPDAVTTVNVTIIFSARGSGKKLKDLTKHMI
jgi:hypothetical protein